jgi:hypothetical protein
MRMKETLKTMKRTFEADVSNLISTSLSTELAFNLRLQALHFLTRRLRNLSPQFFQL